MEGASLSIGKPVFLFDRADLTGGDIHFDVMGDGFLMVQRDPLGMLTEFRSFTTGRINGNSR